MLWPTDDLTRAVPRFSLLPRLRASLVRGAFVGMVAASGATGALLAGEGAAQAQSSRKVAVHVEGSDAAGVREAVAGAIGGDVDTSNRVQQALQKKGWKQTSRSLDDKRLRGALKGVAGDLGLDAIVVVASDKKNLRVLVVDASGEVLASESVAAGDRDAGLKAVFTKAGLVGRPADKPGSTTPSGSPGSPGSPGSSGSPASPAGPGDKAPEAPAASGDDTPRAPGRSIVQVWVGPAGVMRKFDYKDAITGNLRPYSVGGAPGIGAGLELYPAATTSIPVLRDLGLTGRFATTIGLTSKLAGSSEEFKTTYRAYRVGLRGRFLLGSDEQPTVLGLEASYGRSQFEFSGGDARAEEFPAASYTYVRLGPDVTIPIGPMGLMLGAAYGIVTEASPLEDRFPHLSVGMVEGFAGVSVPTGGRVQGRLWVDYTRYFLKMNPEPGDRFVAGGALDQYVTLHLDAMLRL